MIFLSFFRLLRSLAYGFQMGLEIFHDHWNTRKWLATTGASPQYYELRMPWFWMKLHHWGKRNDAHQITVLEGANVCSLLAMLTPAKWVSKADAFKLSTGNWKFEIKKHVMTCHDSIFINSVYLSCTVGRSPAKPPVVPCCSNPAWDAANIGMVMPSGHAPKEPNPVWATSTATQISSGISGGSKLQSNKALVSDWKYLVS